jgi:hypothetical protein
MPAEYIYQEVLSPLFEGFEKSLNIDEISRVFLETYQFVTQLESDTVLMSARELSTMALLTINYCRLHPHENPLEVAKFYAYQYSHNLIPLEHQATFNEHFPRPSFKPIRTEPKETEFYLTPSREEARQQLLDFLNLRNFRIHHAKNNAQRFAGLNAFVLTGPPGIGKSELLQDCLIYQHHLTELDPYDESDKPGFYSIQASMSLKEKEAILIKAFHQGKPVKIDEINSSPMMERSLNDILMGTLNGKIAKKPGFFLITSQNPSHMAGRQKASNALDRRVAHQTLPPYSSDEITDILTHEGLDFIQAHTIAKEFISACKTAELHHYKPAPTFRDLMRFTKTYLRAQLASQEKENTMPTIHNSTPITTTDITKQFRKTLSLMDSNDNKEQQYRRNHH